MPALSPRDNAPMSRTDPPAPSPADDDPVAATWHWLDAAVIGLNLCPFAKAPRVKGQVRVALSTANTPEDLLADLHRELLDLAATDETQTETTLLVHPHVLQDFLDYNDFLGVAEGLLAELGLEGTLQIASFHPDFQFADTEADDITNATNRSPYPTLHLIRESSIDRAVDAFPEAETIYERNMEVMRRLGPEGWAALMRRSRGG